MFVFEGKILLKRQKLIARKETECEGELRVQEVVRRGLCQGRMTIYLGLEKGLTLSKGPGSPAAMGGDGVVLRGYLEGKLIISYIKETI